MAEPVKVTCSTKSCDHEIEHHYANGCVLCDCKWTFGATTFPEDNEPVQYKDA